MTKPTPGGQPGNQNAAGDVKADGHLNIRCNKSHLTRWREAAKRAGKSLSAWVVEHLNRAAL